MANFNFDKPFMKMFGKMNDALDSMIDEIRKYNVSNHEYGVCNSSYKIRFITPQNVSEYIEMLAKAFGNRLIETPGDIERFSVEAAKRMIKDNNCDAFIAAEPMGYTPSTMDYNTLMDIIAGIKNDCFNRSCYSQFDLTQRHSAVLKDLEKITSLKFYTSMKNLVNGIPAVMVASDVINNLKDDIVDIIRESIEEFILFACSVNMITVQQMKDYIIPCKTYTTTKDTHDTVVTECAVLKTNEAELRMNLPFSINIRNIALADVTSGFKDVKNAVKYITTNTASPIAEMIRHYTTDVSKDTLERECYQAFTIIDRIFKYDYRPSSNCPKHVQNEVMHAPDKPNWLDEIAHGNQYIDTAYRSEKQTMGNSTKSPITETLNMIYKVFNGCGCDLTTNEELALNIMKVANTIYQVADKLDYVENPEIVREILALLGEIITRDIIMLVSNNTNVIDYASLNVENTGGPAYLYSESFMEDFDEADFFMEAETGGDTNTAPAPEKKDDKVTVTYKNGDKDKKVSNRLQAFLNWCRKLLANIFKKFNKDHAAEIAYVNKHEQLNNEILESVKNGSFKINVNNFPNFNIKLDAIKPDIEKHVDNWLNLQQHPQWNPKEFEAGLYPGDETTKKNIASKNNPAEKNEAITNVLLYGQANKPQPYTGELNEKLWSEILSDLKTSFNLIDDYTKHLSESLNNALGKLKTGIDTNIEGDDASSQNQDKVNRKKRSEEIVEVLTNLSNVYATTTVNTLTKKFYGTTYNTYAAIIKAYKQQSKSKAANEAEQAPQNNEQQQPNQTQEGETNNG